MSPTTSIPFELRDGAPREAGRRFTTDGYVLAGFVLPGEFFLN